MKRSSLVLFVFLISSPAVAKQKPPLELRLRVVEQKQLTAHKTPRLRAQLTLKNRGNTPLRLATHVKTHELHFDWFKIVVRYPSPSREGCRGRMGGRTRRVLRFVDGRDKSYPVSVTLAPGAKHVVKIDLDRWAKRKINRGFRFGGGHFKLQAVYLWEQKPKGERAGKRKAKVVRIWSNIVRLSRAGPRLHRMCQRNPGWRYF